MSERINRTQRPAAASPRRETLQWGSPPIPTPREPGGIEERFIDATGQFIVERDEWNPSRGTRVMSVSRQGGSEAFRRTIVREGGQEGSSETHIRRESSKPGGEEAYRITQSYFGLPDDKGRVAEQHAHLYLTVRGSHVAAAVLSSSGCGVADLLSQDAQRLLENVRQTFQQREMRLDTEMDITRTVSALPRGEACGPRTRD
jgi:hypothetical protein